MKGDSLRGRPAAGAAIGRRLFLAGLCGVGAAVVLADEAGRRAFAPTAQLTQDGPPLVLVGAGVFRFFFIRYYQCGLYAREGLRQAQAILEADAPRRIALHALLKVWIGERPLDAALKEALLAG